MLTESDLALGDGRTLHVYDTDTGVGTDGLAAFWHHGIPSSGAPPEPLLADVAERGKIVSSKWLNYLLPGRQFLQPFIRSRRSYHDIPGSGGDDTPGMADLWK